MPLHHHPDANVGLLAAVGDDTLLLTDLLCIVMNLTHRVDKVLGVQPIKHSQRPEGDSFFVGLFAGFTDGC